MRRTWLLLGWMACDLAAFVLAYALAYGLRVGFILSTDFPFWPFLAVAAFVAPAWLLVLVTTRCFQLYRQQQSARSLIFLAYGAVMGTALFALAYYFSIGLFFSRLLLLEALVFTFLLSLLVHLAFDRLQRTWLRRDPPHFPTLIVGVTRESMALVERLNRVGSLLKPVAILDGRGAKETSVDGVPVLGRLNKLEEVLVSQRITHLIQCSDLEQSINLLSACRSRGLTYLLLPSVLGIVGDDERVEMLEGQPVTVVSGGRKWWHAFL